MLYPLNFTPIVLLLSISYHSIYANQHQDKSQSYQFEPAQQNRLDRILERNPHLPDKQPVKKGAQSEYAAEKRIHAEEEKHKRHIDQIYEKGKDNRSDSENFYVRRQ